MIMIIVNAYIHLFEDLLETFKISVHERRAKSGTIAVLNRHDLRRDQGGIKEPITHVVKNSKMGLGSELRET